MWLRWSLRVCRHISSTLTVRSIDTVSPCRMTVPNLARMSRGVSSSGCSRTNTVTMPRARKMSTMDRHARSQNASSLPGASQTGAGYPYGDTASRRPESGISRTISGSSNRRSFSPYQNAVAVPPVSRASSATYSGTWYMSCAARSSASVHSGALASSSSAQPLVTTFLLFSHRRLGGRGGTCRSLIPPPQPVPYAPGIYGAPLIAEIPERRADWTSSLSNPAEGRVNRPRRQITRFLGFVCAIALGFRCGLLSCTS
jgi:hypothetical protein